MDKKQLKDICADKFVDNSCDEFSSDNDDIVGNDKITDTGTSEFVERCELLLRKIRNDYIEQRNEIKCLIKLHKKELKKARKEKKPRNVKAKTGFAKPTTIPNKLADFVHIARGTEISRIKLTKLISDEFKKRNLRYEKDKRVIIPDEEVKKLFNLSDETVNSRNPKDINGLNFYTLQKHIAGCYKTEKLIANSNAENSLKITSNTPRQSRRITNNIST